ncbi:MAG: site-specific DNA-methyltransferase [Gemmatimonas sp.]|jgi:adenine-specific DNA-methyltransferase|nr:site-specific DNA-methyltransferase [Gemmatimonas sp.]
MPELFFKGKEFVHNHHLSVPFRPLLPKPELSVGDVRLDGNLIVHGDNLFALKALLPAYSGGVDCIFIDPPYNTGTTDKWAYNDNVSGPMFEEWLASSPVSIEDGLRHDKWCAMMYPRLKLMHELLSDRGSIWITLDDNEVHHCRAMLDEIFGENSIIAQIAWQKRTSRENRATMSPSFDHVIAYSKDLADTWRLYRNLLEPSEDGYSNPDSDPRGDWKSIPFTAQGFRRNQVYEITSPSGTVFLPPRGRCWAMVESEFERLKSLDKIYWPREGEGRPRVKQFPHEAKGLVPDTLWLSSEVGDTEESKKLLMEIFPERADLNFHAPKPYQLVQRIVAIATSKDSVVLDSFAGTGTTAHSVLKQNAKDEGRRRFILVEQEDYAESLTAERVRRVITGYPFRGTYKEELYSANITLAKARGFAAVEAEADAEVLFELTRFDGATKALKAGVFSIDGTKEVDSTSVGLAGTFTYCELGQPIVLDDLLRGDSLPESLALGSLLFHTATNQAFDASVATTTGALSFLGESRGTYVWLVYKPELEFLRSADAALTMTLAKQIAAHNPSARHVVFAAARFVSQRLLNEAKVPVEFAPLPWSLYRVQRS